MELLANVYRDSPTTLSGLLRRDQRFLYKFAPVGAEQIATARRRVRQSGSTWLRHWMIHLGRGFRWMYWDSLRR